MTETWTGAPGVVRAVPPVITPAQGVRVKKAPRSPIMKVLLVPSEMSEILTRLLRKKTPLPTSVCVAMLSPHP